MDKSLRKKALEQLVKVDEKVADDALLGEAKNIALILENETDYHNLEDSLEFLQIISPKTSGETISVLTKFLSRLESVELTYQLVQGIPLIEMQRYFSKEYLILKVLNILNYIRYRQTGEVIEMLLNYSIHDNKEISKQSLEYLASVVKLNIDVYNAIGLIPQKKSLKYIENLDQSALNDYFSGVMVICEKLLSTEMEGTTWSYDAVTLSKAAVPISEDVLSIRESALSFLEKLYFIVSEVSQKNSVIDSMMAASRTSSLRGASDDELKIILDATEAILVFYKKIIPNADLQIIKKIEHNTRVFYRRGVRDSIKQLALEVRSILGANEEYQIYKVLVSDDAEISNWDKEINFDEERAFKNKKIEEYIQDISEKNFFEWEERILKYIKIQLDNGVTFLPTVNFLEKFGKKTPLLGIKFINEHEKNIGNFVIPILGGILKSDSKVAAQDILNMWISKCYNLTAIAKLLEFTKEADIPLIHKLMIKAKESNDISALNQIVSSVSEVYEDKYATDLKLTFLESISQLTQHKNTDWILNFWFRSKRPAILNSLNEKEVGLLLNNLIFLNKIDFHAEEVLSDLANSFPEKIIDFFGERFKKQNENKRDYEAVPYEFYRLISPLSKNPRQVIETIAQWFEGNYGSFVHQGARLLKNIFPEFPKHFENELITFLNGGDDRKILIVIAVIRNYKGSLLSNISKELIKVLPKESKHLSEIKAILLSTGVVSGEFGLADAYKEIKNELEFWFNDENPKIRYFAENFSKELDEIIDTEIRRRKEDIALRKHQYGDDEFDNLS